MLGSRPLPGLAIHAVSMNSALNQHGHPYALTKAPWRVVHVFGGLGHEPLLTPHEFVAQLRAKKIAAHNPPTLIMGQPDTPDWKIAALAHEATFFSDFVAVYDQFRETFVVIFSRVIKDYPFGAEIECRDPIPAIKETTELTA